MDQKEFLKILNRYRSGKASEAERKVIDEWYESLGQRTDELMPTQKEEELKSDYWATITDHIAHSPKSMPTPSTEGYNRFVFGKFAVGVAASLLLVLISWIYLSLNPIEKESISVFRRSEVKWEKLANLNNTPQLFLLSDGSKVILDPHSWIKIAPGYNVRSRNLELEGKAFFEVAHNKNKPFIVNANGLITKVLGTSFTIKSFAKDKKVEVEVKSGKVAVYREKSTTQQRPEIILTGNLKVVYDKASKNVAKRIVDRPEPLTGHAEIRRLRFDEAMVSEVFEAMEKTYGVKIVFDEAVFSSCKLTTSIAKESLYDRLDIITSAIGATYSIDENKIRINGEGCK